MNHPHWVRNGKNQVNILAVPNQSTIGHETEEFIIHTYRPGTTPNAESKTYQCEIRGGENIFVFTNYDKTNGMSRSLIDSGTINEATKEISFSNSGDTWTAVFEKQKPQPIALPAPVAAPALAPVPIEARVRPHPPPGPLPPTPTNPTSPTAPCESCRPCPKCEVCKPGPGSGPGPGPAKSAATWMYVAISLMSLLALIFLLWAVPNFVKARKSAPVVATASTGSTASTTGQSATRGARLFQSP
jgi:hypothetical protein